MFWLTTPFIFWKAICLGSVQSIITFLLDKKNQWIPWWIWNLSNTHISRLINCSGSQKKKALCLLRLRMLLLSFASLLACLFAFFVLKINHGSLFWPRKNGMDVLPVNECLISLFMVMTGKSRQPDTFFSLRVGMDFLSRKITDIYWFWKQCLSLIYCERINVIRWKKLDTVFLSYAICSSVFLCWPKKKYYKTMLEEQLVNMQALPLLSINYFRIR